MRFRDITGQRFARLVALRPVSSPAVFARRGFHWVCQCDCGTVTLVASIKLRTDGRGTKSCGCVRQILHERRKRK